MASRTPGLDEIVESLQDDWRRWLRARQGSLSQSHEDLVQQATADLLEWVDRREAPLNLEDVRRVGFRILERRAYDAHRGAVRRWAEDAPERDAEQLASPDSGPEQSAAYSQLLKVLIDMLSQLAASDRELILRDEFFGGAGRPSAMSPAERKRLSRLRQELRSQLLLKHGIDISAT